MTTLEAALEALKDVTPARFELRRGGESVALAELPESRKWRQHIRKRADMVRWDELVLFGKEGEVLAECVPARAPSAQEAIDDQEEDDTPSERQLLIALLDHTQAAARAEVQRTVDASAALMEQTRTTVAELGAVSREMMGTVLQVMKEQAAITKSLLESSTNFAKTASSRAGKAEILACEHAAAASVAVRERVAEGGGKEKPEDQWEAFDGAVERVGGLMAMVNDLTEKKS